TGERAAAHRRLQALHERQVIVREKTQAQAGLQLVDQALLRELGICADRLPHLLDRALNARVQVKEGLLFRRGDERGREHFAHWRRPLHWSLIQRARQSELLQLREYRVERGLEAQRNQVVLERTL